MPRSVPGFQPGSGLQAGLQAGHREVGDAPPLRCLAQHEMAHRYGGARPQAVGSPSATWLRSLKN